MTKKDYRTLSNTQINNFMKRFHARYPAGRWDPHYFNYIAHDTQGADFHRHEVSQYEFHFLGPDSNYDLRVGTQDYPGYDNQTVVGFRQTFPTAQEHLVFESSSIPTLRDVQRAPDLLTREAFILSRKLIREIQKKCHTK